MTGRFPPVEDTSLGADPTLAEPDLELPPARLEDFEIVQELAQHAGVTSYLAIRRGVLGFSKPVLLRVADAPFHERPDVGLRITDEARLGMHLAHPNLLTTLDLGRDHDRFFLVRQWVSGLGLRAMLKATWAAGESVPLPVALRMAVGVCRGLDHLHALRTPWAPKGLLHRAVQPSNVLLSTAGEVRLANVSVPRAADAEEHTRGGAAGERMLKAYLAPEIVEGLAADHRADFFAVGAMLYECIVGPDAFVGDPDSDWNRFRTWAGGPPEHPRLQTLPVAVRVVLKGTLSGDRERRFNESAELRRLLQTILREEYRSDGDEELRAAVARWG